MISGPISRPLHYFRLVVVRAIVKPVREDPLGIAFGVLELVVFDRPEKSKKADAAQYERDRYKNRKNIHFIRPIRMEFSDTVIELADMASAAISGVANPASARGTEIML